MHILIAGASGFIGKVLVNHLAQSHEITVLGRNVDKIASLFSKKIDRLSWDNLQDHDAKQYDVIINLSGASIGAKRWSAKIKQELIDSRVMTNQRLTAWLIAHHVKPRFFCANAIGIYGAQAMSKDFFDEAAPLPLSSSDFLQQIGLVWEQSLKPAVDVGIPVTTLRFGVVLKKGEGMLKKLEPSFYWGAGSVLGSGNQSLSWIYYKDLIHAIDFLLAHPEVTGPVNITSPYPVTQREFAQSLAKALKRPLLFKMPSFVVQMLFGEMGDYLLLKGQKVLPKRLNELGFKFTAPQLDSVLMSEFGNRS